VSDSYQTLSFTETFLETFGGKSFNWAERRRLLKALRLLDANERHPSLRVHELRGDLAGVWSVSASKELRITFERMPGGHKLLLTCSHHHVVAVEDPGDGC
jgi:mRNA-degrading endonuclease YafQ of YafQ-DinJ toxin-antitoxin module